MHELRFQRVDGDFLILENSDGETYRVPLDESVKKLIYGQPAKVLETGNLSPREIQEAIRSGVGISELAERTGANPEYVANFAAPVIDELAHVVQTALSVRITVAGDRYSDTVQVEFGDMIADRLKLNGLIDPIWSSFKPEDGQWRVVCDLGETSAQWVFDAKKLNLSPDSELAVQLSAQQGFADAPIPKLRPVTNQARPSPAASPTVPAAFAKPVEAPSTSTVDLGDTMEFEGVIPFGRSKSPEPAEPTMGDNLANTADLLDALRKKRQQREELEKQTEEATPTAFAPATVTMPLEVVPDLPSEAEVSQVVPEPEPEPAPKPSKKGRAAVPSWNDIVFGTRSESED